MRTLIIIAAVVLLTLVGSNLVQAPKAGGEQSATAPKPQTFTITGKITKAVYAYLIKVQKPPERSAIKNPNPEVLDNLVKSGKT